MERNDYIHIFNKFLENKATPSEIKLLIEWLKERKAFDTWADDIWMQSPDGNGSFSKTTFTGRTP